MRLASGCLVTTFVALSALMHAPPVVANGRFPQANYLVLGPGARNDLIVLRATFGLVLSRDRGARWDWVCEEALDAVGSFDPSVALGSDQRVALGLPDGMRTSSPDQCAWTVPAGAAPSVTDITQDADGAVMFAAGTDYAGAAATTLVYRSDDRGRSWRVTARMPAYIVETIDVAPGDPRRVYLSGYRPGAVGTILRSDDGGAMFQATAAQFPELASVWIAAVNPRNPAQLWLRVAAGLGTQLRRSDDGGASTVAIATTSEPMDGFALSDDGDTVWYGTADRSAGIYRSVRGGAFARVRATASVRCMRHHGGLLFVCGDEATDGYSLAWSADGGDTLNPLMSVRDITGPLPGCAGDGGVSSACAPVWTQFAPQLRDLDAAAPVTRVPLPAEDAGAPDATLGDASPRDVPALDGPRDAAADTPSFDATADAKALDAPGIDRAQPDVAPFVDAPSDRGFVSERSKGDAGADVGAPAPRPPRSGCACRTRPRERTARAGTWLLLAATLTLRSRRRREAPRR